MTTRSPTAEQLVTLYALEALYVHRRVQEQVSALRDVSFLSDVEIVALAKETANVSTVHDTCG